MRSARTKGKRSAKLARNLALLGCGLLLAALALSWTVETIDVPPRSLAGYVERRASGHNALIEATGRRLARLLIWLDRGGASTRLAPGLRPGAVAEPTPTAHPRGARERVVRVATSEEAARAIEHAEPGDAITFVPGTYRFTGSAIAVNRAGTEAAAIKVRADRPDTVLLELDMAEGFLVSAPYWTFENLNLRGACARHADCEHAFHVVGRASHFVARNNSVSDFNAHFKINGVESSFPDDGLIEGNALSNRSIRETESSVTPVDLVAASRWLIRGNRISDFVRAGSDRVSYGAFAKGGGAGNVFERNIVVCEDLLTGAPGQRIGIALGGGGTGQAYCRDARCITEQDNSSIRNNLIVSCSDDGIYINRSATSRIEHNTLIDTGGISVRFVESSADVEGNLVDGSIRSRDGGALHAADNRQTSMTQLYLGWHPVRGLFSEHAIPMWAANPPRRAATPVLEPDLCAVPRPPHPAYGAVEDISKC
jgi:parallel beta-helix repeat protein